MKHKSLAILGFLGAPMLYIDTLTSTYQQEDTWKNGLLGLIYMGGWMWSIMGLQLLTKSSAKWIRVILHVQLALLLVAQVYNFDVFIEGTTRSYLQRITDVFWPISNLFMIVTAVAVFKSGVFKGWKKFAVPAVALWLPSIIVLMHLPTETIGHAHGLWSAISWLVMAIAIFLQLSATEKLRENETAVKPNIVGV